MTAAAQSLRNKIVIVGNSKLVKNHHFVLNYLTVLVYIYVSVGGSWWIIASPRRGLVKYPPTTSHLHFGE